MKKIEIWEAADKASSDFRWVIFDSRGHPVASAYFWGSSTKELELRARLISASPELLEACNAVYKLMKAADTSSMKYEDGARFAAVRWQVQVAIAKAEGRD